MSLKSVFLPVIVSLFLFSSCDSLRIYEENQTIENGTWSVSDKKVFAFSMEDTTQLCNIFLNVRHRGDYAYSNLYLFITTNRPDGKMSVDTVECVLQDNEGKWLGNALQSP